MSTIVLTLLAIGLAAPFLAFENPLSGLIGLVILFVGIHIAWKLTDGTPTIEIVGPFTHRSPVSLPPSAG